MGHRILDQKEDTVYMEYGGCKEQKEDWCLSQWEEGQSVECDGPRGREIG